MELKRCKKCIYEKSFQFIRVYSFHLVSFLSFYLSLYSFISLFNCLSVYLLICPSIYGPIYRSIDLSSNLLNLSLREEMLVIRQSDTTCNDPTKVININKGVHSDINFCLYRLLCTTLALCSSTGYHWSYANFESNQMQKFNTF